MSDPPLNPTSPSGDRPSGRGGRPRRPGRRRSAERSRSRGPGRRPPAPVPTYPPELPITERRADLLEAIAAHQVLVVAGETGSGKSTQIPKLCLELGRGVEGLIGHTQPRRVAARTIAERVSEELGTDLGDTVGYSVRFNDRVGASTYIKVMTDGILLAEIGRDRLLRRYDTIIIDEAHERSLNIDFLLGYLKQLLPRRPDLKLIITSATIDTARFSAHFDEAPVIEVSGRSYPVEIRYRPYGEPVVAEEGDDILDDDRDQTEAVCDAVEELIEEGPGDVLVFLSGEREIRDTEEALIGRARHRRNLADVDILPMYARLSAAEQHRVFEAHRGRRVVLATNVAETSITVPGVRYVVDAGTARVLRYSHRLKVQRLPIEAISQASANQRAGRCGRVGPGVCIRLYSEEDFAQRPEFTDPEILRTNLASVILAMTDLGLGDVAAFPFLDPPDPRSVNDGVALLEELGALPADQPVESRRLTEVGRRLARLPIDPRMARMVIAAHEQNCTREVLIIAAALSIQDPRERPADHRQAADEMHRRFAVPGSDFLALVRLWDHLAERREALSSNQFRRECRAEFINYLRVREWWDLHRQIRQAAARLDLGSPGGSNRGGPDGGGAHPDQIHKALLAGLLSHIGMRDRDTREFRGARNARFQIAHGSNLARKPPEWVMAAELVETNRLWARMAAAIRPEWAEDLGRHLVKRSFGDPRWDERSARAVTSERVTLYGLPVVANRRIGFDRVDPDEARDLFVDHALVRREWDSPHRFLEENEAVLAEARALGDRFRRVDPVDEDALFRFYDRRVGEQVVSGRHFDQWWKKTRRNEPDRLTMTLADLYQPADDDRTATEASELADYPDTWVQGDLSLPVTYRFEPGHDLDGVTVHVPLAVLNRVEPWDFDWQVPGLRRDLILALVRTLPKDLRRRLGPLNETAHRAADLLGWQPVPISEALADLLSEISGVPVPAGAFDARRLDPHLRITFAITEGDEVLALGKDLEAVKELVGGRVRAAIAKAVGAAPRPDAGTVPAEASPSASPGDSSGIERSGLTRWDFGDLPRVVRSSVDGFPVEGYPALLDRGESVDIKVFSKPQIAHKIMAGGIRRLLLLSVPVGVRGLERGVSNQVRLALAALDDITLGSLLRDTIAATADEVVRAHGDAAGHDGTFWTEAHFEDLLHFARGELKERASVALGRAGEVVVAAAQVRALLDSLVNPAVAPSVADAHEQFARLVRPGFVTTTGTHRLPDLVRYLTAIVRRLERVGEDPARDRRRIAEVKVVEDDYRKLLGALTASQITPKVVATGWLIEELRVSVFAQAVGAKGPVSAKRIRRAIDDLFAGNLD